MKKPYNVYVSCPRTGYAYLSSHGSVDSAKRKARKMVGRELARNHGPIKKAVVVEGPQHGRVLATMRNRKGRELSRKTWPREGSR